MVGEAVLPAGAVRVDTPLPSELRGPWEVPAGVNLVGVHRVWSVPMGPDVVVAFLKTHAPAGFVESGVGTFTSRSSRVMDVVDELGRLPANIAVAGLEIGVEAHGAGSLVNVIAGAQWTVLRPGDERVGDRHAVVVVSELPWSHDAPAGRRVVATGARRSAIVRAFNMQNVSATVGGDSCFALGVNTVSYRVAFAPSAAAMPDVVATIAPCTPVGVTVNGRRSVSLAWGSGGLDSAVAHALGEANLTFESRNRNLCGVKVSRRAWPGGISGASCDALLAPRTSGTECETIEPTSARSAACVAGVGKRRWGEHASAPSHPMMTRSLAERPNTSGA
jgi:hypothetical protein